MRSLLAFALSVFMFSECLASSGMARSLDSVFREAHSIIRGMVVGAGFGPCGSSVGPESYYLLRVDSVLKGSKFSGDVRMCGATAPLLLASEYIISGRPLNEGGLEFDADGIILVFSEDRYYRVISYDSPIASSKVGEIYAVAIEEEDFLGKFSKYFGAVD